SFITCPFGIEYVGLVMVAFGICDSIVSLLVGFVHKRIGRLPCMLVAALLSYGLFGALLKWQPTQMYPAFIIAGLFGVADAIFDPITTGQFCMPLVLHLYIFVCVSAIYGTIFPKSLEPAYATNDMCQQLGFMIIFLYASLSKVQVSIILQIIYLTIAMTGYLLMEYIERKKPKDSDDNDKTNRMSEQY
ncbi:unnamed protein product, partial [Didymodactylos carnosus]